MLNTSKTSCLGNKHQRSTLATRSNNNNNIGILLFTEEAFSKGSATWNEDAKALGSSLDVT